MEDLYVYKDEYDNDCTFLRKKYYEKVSALITDFFEEPLPDNDLTYVSNNNEGDTRIRCRYNGYR